MSKDTKHKREDKKKATMSLKERRAKKQEKRQNKIAHRIDDSNVDQWNAQ